MTLKEHRRIIHGSAGHYPTPELAAEALAVVDELISLRGPDWVPLPLRGWTLDHELAALRHIARSRRAAGLGKNGDA